MTEPSQYFKGRTVQEQMNEVIGYVDVRSAEVATDAIAADVAQVHQDMLDADADATAAAASAAAAAGTLANAVKKTGESSQTVEGDITMSTGDLGVAGDVGVQGQLSVLGGCDLRTPVTVPTPSNNTDAANKQYVDSYHDATKINITDINSYAVGLTGNQGPVTGTKSFSNIIIGVASLGNNGNSEFINAGSYKSIFRIAKSSLSTFRGVLCIISWERSTGRNPELVQVGVHGNTATTIYRYSIGGSATCDYFVSADNDYVYIGIKSRISNVSDNSKQMMVLTCVGFNTLTAVEAYNGSIVVTPDGSLIAETS